MNFVIDLKDRAATRRALVVATAVLRAQASEDGEDLIEELELLTHLKRQLLRAPTVEEFNVKGSTQLPIVGWIESNFQTLEEQGWRSPPDFPRYLVSRKAEVFDIQEQKLLKKKSPPSAFQYKMINEFDQVFWFTSYYLLKCTWPELVED